MQSLRKLIVFNVVYVCNEFETCCTVTAKIQLTVQKLDVYQKKGLFISCKQGG